MQSRLNPYLSFKDNARQAMEFYLTVFDGKIEIHTFGEYEMPHDEGEGDKVMHSMLTASNGIVFMAADTPNSMGYKTGTNISMSLSGDNEAELSEYFVKLSEGGEVTMPLSDSPWGDKFGILVDQFGICWMVNVSKKGDNTQGN